MAEEVVTPRLGATCPVSGGQAMTVSAVRLRDLPVSVHSSV